MSDISGTIAIVINAMTPGRTFFGSSIPETHVKISDGVDPYTSIMFDPRTGISTPAPIDPKASIPVEVGTDDVFLVSLDRFQNPVWSILSTFSEVNSHLHVLIEERQVNSREPERFRFIVELTPYCPSRVIETEDQIRHLNTNTTLIHGLFTIGGMLDSLTTNWSPQVTDWLMAMSVEEIGHAIHDIVNRNLQPLHELSAKGRLSPQEVSWDLGEWTLPGADPVSVISPGEDGKIGLVEYCRALGLEFALRTSHLKLVMAQRLLESLPLLMEDQRLITDPNIKETK